MRHNTHSQPWQLPQVRTKKVQSRGKRSFFIQLPIWPIKALALLAYLSPITGWATSEVDEPPIILSTAVNLALQHAPEWQSLQKQIAAQKENQYQARSGLLPSVVLSAQTAKTEVEVAGLTTEGNSHSTSLQITQPILNLDSWFTYRAAKASANQLDHQLKANYQAFIVDTAETYLEVLRAQSQLTFTKAELSATRRQLEQAQQRFRVGLIAITDVHEAQAANDLAEVNQIAASTNLDITFENLGRLTGTTITSISQVKKNLLIVNPAPNNMSDWVQQAQNNNPEIMAASANKGSAKQNLLSARAKHSPTINLFATKTDSNDIDQNFDRDRTVIGAEINYPLFQGLGNLSINRQASLNHLAAADDLATAIKNSTQNTRNLFRSVQTDVLRVKARQQAITSSQSALEATEAGYEVGTRNVVDVLNAQRSLFAAKRDFASAKYDYIINTLRLKQAVGDINAEAIEELDDWLE